MLTAYVRRLATAPGLKGTRVLTDLGKWFEPLCRWRLWLLPATVSLFLVLIASFNFLAFHTFIELITIVISFLIFSFAWSTRKFTKNSFLLFLACGYFWIGSLDLMHTLTYKGMNIFDMGTVNLSVQFWIGTRYLEAFLLLAAPFVAMRHQDGYKLLAAFGLVAISLTLVIFSGLFPAGFIEGEGLTSFKIYSEYLIIGILVVALINIFRFGGSLSNSEKMTVAAAIFMTMCAELAFTFYVDVYGLSNLIGHIFKLFSFWLIFRAIVYSHLIEPYMALMDSRDESEAANRAKSEFLGNMSHELRTPLNAILGFAEILKLDSKNPLTHVQGEQVDYIVDSGNHLLRLVNQVLDLSRIEANQLDLELEDVEIVTAVRDCIGLTGPLSNAQGIAVENKIDANLPTMLLADPLRLKQVILNILSNAINYSKQGGQVTIHGHTTPNGLFRVSVTDKGIGIPEHKHARVFGMFDRLDVSTEISSEGAGIGLTVSKFLIESMNGKIGFESQQDLGSTFWFELPPADQIPAITPVDASTDPALKLAKV